MKTLNRIPFYSCTLLFLVLLGCQGEQKPQPIAQEVVPVMRADTTHVIKKGNKVISKKDLPKDLQLLMEKHSATDPVSISIVDDVTTIKYRDGHVVVTKGDNSGGTLVNIGPAGSHPKPIKK